MNSNCLLHPQTLIGPYKDDLISNIVYNSCKDFLLKDVKDSSTANELEQYIKNNINSVNDSKLEDKSEINSKKKNRHRKRKKKTKTQHISTSENEDSSDESDSEIETEPYIHIKLSNEKVEANIEKYKIKVGASLRFGNNKAIVSDKIVSDSRARMEFVNICWLSTIPDDADLLTIVSLPAAQMFITFQYAIEIYDSMKEKNYVDRYLDNQVTVVKRDGDLENKLKNSEEISNFINKIDFSQVVAKTEMFGDIGYPTDEELIDFATNFRMCRHL